MNLDTLTTSYLKNSFSYSADVKRIINKTGLNFCSAHKYMNQSILSLCVYHDLYGLTNLGALFLSYATLTSVFYDISSCFMNIYEHGKRLLVKLRFNVVETFFYLIHKTL